MSRKARPKSVFVERMQLEIYPPDLSQQQEWPFALTPVSAGFPSPADDYQEKKLDLNAYLIRRPASTFFVKVKGNSMQGASIHDGDLLIVDRSASVADNKIVIGVVNGEFTVKRIRKRGTKIFLLPENPEYSPIELKEGMDFSIWGVVMYVIHQV
jgi:DNA polymerase V